MFGWGLLPTARQHPNEMVVKRISVGGDGTRTANGWRSQGPNDPPPSGLPPASRGEGEGEEGRAGSRRQYCTVFIKPYTRGGRGRLAQPACYARARIGQTYIWIVTLSMYMYS